MIGEPPADLTIEVRFARSVILAASRTDRRAPEWPLHWGRLFNALVDALHAGDPARISDEELAVRWIEGLPPPTILAPVVHPTALATVYVPSNDQSINKDREPALPEAPWRRKPRVSPGVTARIPLLRYCWTVPGPELDRHHAALSDVLGRITYFGRSANFAVAGLASGPPAGLPDADHLETYTPDPDGLLEMRIAARGRLDALRHQYNAGRQPDPGPTSRYRLPGTQPSELPVVASIWADQWLVSARTGGARAAITDTEAVAKAVRRELVKRVRRLAVMRGEAREFSADLPVDGFISGHELDGTPYKGNRLAIAPLANILHQHADNMVLGFVVLVPAGTPQIEWERLSCLLRGYDGPNGSLPPLDDLPLKHGSMSVARPGLKPSTGLASVRYAGPARSWATVTPVLLGRHPKTQDPAEVAGLVAAACVQSGLPEPERVEVRQHGFIDGSPPARRFAQTGSTAGAQRHQKWATHAAVHFGQAVRGPVLVGAGRFHGLGLMVPRLGDSDPFEDLALQAADG